MPSFNVHSFSARLCPFFFFFHLRTWKMKSSQMCWSYWEAESHDSEEDLSGSYAILCNKTCPFLFAATTQFQIRKTAFGVGAMILILPLKKWMKKANHCKGLCLMTTAVSALSRPLSRRCHPAISSSVVPFSSCPQSFPSIRVFSNESALCIRWPKYWSFSITPSGEYSGLIFFRI